VAKPSHKESPADTVIVGPDSEIIASPVREQEETLVADLDLSLVPAHAGSLTGSGTTTDPTYSAATWTPGR
jgi:hypothetical protein